MIDGKINPKCIDISDQASHSFYNNELDIWLNQMRKFSLKVVMSGDLIDSLKIMLFQLMRCFYLLYEGAANYVNEIYSEGRKDRYPELINVKEIFHIGILNLNTAL